jgi:predicted dinucleotide-utilizing enzyme
MTLTVDLVIAGDGSAARAAAVDALQRRHRVLVLLPSANARAARRLRRSLCKVTGAGGGRLSVMSGAEVVCADGVDGLEAVVVRHAPTGRLSAVNASALWRADRTVDGAVLPVVEG